MTLTWLQLIGPVALFGFVFAAEVAAFALGSVPSSGFLWYLNLEWFAAFQRSYYILSASTDLSYVQLLGIACPLMVTAIVGFMFQYQLPLAAASNLSFVYASFVTYAWLKAPTISQASLVSISIPTGPDLYLVAVLLAGSLTSLVISHLLYLRAVRTRPIWTT